MTGLVLEGGSMRGMFTSGIIDVLLENGIRFDGAVGVSAGATFGVNIKSRQIGRAIRYNLAYCRDPRYCSWRSYFSTGDLFGREFCYETLPSQLDPFDGKTFAEDPMTFYCVTTDVDTGKAVYYRLTDCGERDMTWIRASASMPMVSQIVEIDGRRMLDGGMADSIPLRFMEKHGYARNVVILTQPAGYVKKPSRLAALMSVRLKKYPNLIRTMKERHLMYNRETAYVREREEAGAAFVFRPPHKLNVGHIEHDPEKLLSVYLLGREEALKNLDALNMFLE